MSEEKNCTSLKQSNEFNEITELKFDELILNEILEFIDKNKDDRGRIKFGMKHLLSLKHQLLAYNIANNTSILSNVVKRLKSNPNLDEHEQFKITMSNLLEANSSNQPTLNETALKNSQTNPKVIIVIEDEFNFTIKFQKSTVTKPVTTNGKKDCTIIDAMELDNTVKPIGNGGELQPLVDESSSDTSNENNSVNNFYLIPRKSYKSGPKSKTKDEFYDFYETGRSVLKDTIMTKKFSPSSNSDSSFSSDSSFQQSEKSNENYFLMNQILTYPPPYPEVPWYNYHSSLGLPAPILNIKSFKKKVVALAWNMELTAQMAKIQNYELFLCKETEEEPDVSMWKLLDVIQPDILPMIRCLDSFEEGFTYHFILRAVDIHQRRGPFSAVQITIS